jgi:NADPH-dependent 2,4-dienoyl-CoA reductase/sulfur reductase-like enzyme
MDRLLVIGGVAAGTTAAARARRCCPGASIAIYEQEEFVSYSG